MAVSDSLLELEAESTTQALEQFTLTITAENIVSTDPRFTMDDLKMGDQYKPLRVWFENAQGEKIERAREPRERHISNMTLPYLAFQLYEQQIKQLSLNERLQFPIGKESPDAIEYKGIFYSKKEYQHYSGQNTFATLTYKRSHQGSFVIHCWNIFSTLHLVQECLKRFGNPGDKFELVYREKGSFDAEDEELTNAEEEDGAGEDTTFLNEYSQTLLDSKNIIFRGAPGTGKTYLARQIAADIISEGKTQDFNKLEGDQKRQVEFVQFHPSYDYSDFVEGLRPRINDDGTMGFELQDGIFKKFVDEARKNYEDRQKSGDRIRRESSIKEAMGDFFESVDLGVTPFKTTNGNEFFVTNVDDTRVHVSIPGNQVTGRIIVSLADIETVLADEGQLRKVKDLRRILNTAHNKQEYSYIFVLCNKIKKFMKAPSARFVDQVQDKRYVFIIDEINRGEISKIFGELFFAVDPGYRGERGGVATQYFNLHLDQTKKFYIPRNVYIIGTMNDIDRSVDSFDFAMRRRFRFIELRAQDQIAILDNINDPEVRVQAKQRMTALNRAITGVEDLNENYEIGPAYFLKLDDISFDQLWTDYLEPLLREYVQGLYGEAEIMAKFAKAYGYPDISESALNEEPEN